MSAMPATTWSLHLGCAHSQPPPPVCLLFPMSAYVQARVLSCGMHPLLVANEKGKVAPFYVKDEPRVAIAAVLENGWTVINVHLSFVPFVNVFQLLKVSRWAKKLEKNYYTKVALVGDFNLPWGIPTRATRWKRATVALTYPSWKPAISFDYILLRRDEVEGAVEVIAPQLTISDHRPISIDI